MFELDSSNTVRYSRFEGEGRGAERGANDISGAILFDASEPFSNSEEFRRRINNFRSNGAHADSFDFTFDYEDGPLPVRVLMARVRESSEADSAKSVLIHVRQRR